jgi:spoIIIJ-associated protein
MKEKRATLEVIAPTVDEAVAKGLSDLGLPEDMVEVEILDQGSRGLFGLGSRHARIRLAVKSSKQITKEREAAPVAPKEPQSKPESKPESKPDEFVADETVEEASLTELVEKEPVEELEEDEHVLRVARETVNEILEKMKVRAQVTSQFKERDEERGRVPVFVDVRGDDLSILIGRRAETLNALQYISTLIVNKELGRSITLIIDVEGYRSRREGQLRQLARRMADQAVKTGRRQVLEPMPANERRIVHIELRQHDGVTTESIGEEPRRKVTITPKD